MARDRCALPIVEQKEIIDKSGSLVLKVHRSHSEAECRDPLLVNWRGEPIQRASWAAPGDGSFGLEEGRVT